MILYREFYCNLFDILSLTKYYYISLLGLFSIYLVFVASKSRKKKMRRLPLPFGCPALISLLITAAWPDRPFSTPAMGAGANGVRIVQAEKTGRARDPLRLIHGERATCSRPAPVAEPLDPPTTSALTGASKFSAGEHFRENVAPGAEVGITWLGATFMRRFAIKIEDTVGPTTIQFHTLLRPSRDQHIIHELDDRHETRLGDVWCLLKRQSNGEAGTLLVNAVPNIFYVRDGSGELGAVDAVWGGAGWEIGASPVDGDRLWPAGARVLSR
jgi:hypothetical protein